jgi:hypothetical protein
VRPKAVRQAAAPVPQPEPSQVVQGEWRVVESEEAGGPRRLPWRLALPEAPKGARSVSTEDRARLKGILDFARSLPLPEPGHDADWLVDLAQADAGDEPRPRVAELLLKGEQQPRYEPAWRNHPIYHDLSDVLQGQPILQELETFVGAVGESASEAVGLLRDIYAVAVREADSELSTQAYWPYIAAVYSDAMNWFLGRSLREPSERDDSIRPAGDSAAATRYLYAEDTTPFSGQLLQAADEAQATRLRSLHLKLRRMYRNDERARQLASLITRVEVQRNHLSDSFSQLGRAGQ